MYTILLYTLFIVFFIFNVEKLTNTNTFKYLSKYSFIANSFLLVVLSMAGIPPLLGFLNKFLIFNFLFFKCSYLWVTIFSIMNFFSIYFYIFNLKFLTKKNFKNFFFFKNNKILFSKNNINTITHLNFFNLFSIFFFNVFLLFFINICLTI